MTFRIEIGDPDLAKTETMARTGCEFTVNSYTWDAVGGPKEASISARGTAEALSRLATLLRSPVYIYDDRGEKVWFGLLYNVEIRIGMWTISVSIGSMSNKVAVTYSELKPGETSSTTKMTTAYTEDITSQARYGVKQRIFNIGDALAEVATAKRDMYLALSKLPVRQIQSGTSEGGSLSALIVCKGWYSTLNWQLYAHPTGAASYVDQVGVTQPINFGKAAAGSVSKVAQGFKLTIEGTWYADLISFHIRKFASPVDSVKYSICNDNAGVPGTEIVSTTFVGSTLSEQYAWILKALTRSGLTKDVLYWVVAERTGSASDVNYYSVMANEALGYTNGVCRVYKSGSWQALTVDADLLFTVNVVEETSLQIYNMLSSAYAPFFTGVEVTPVSGVFSNPYRSGEQGVGTILSELMQTGTSNGLRYLATITRERKLIIYEQPTTTELQIDKNNAVWSQATNVPVPLSTCPVGKWADFIGLPDQLVSDDTLKAGAEFIESSRYVVEQGVLEITPAVPDSLTDLEIV